MLCENCVEIIKIVLPQGLNGLYKIFTIYA